MEKDIASFIQDRGTGQEIPDPPKYINFCRGDMSDAGSEASEDERYSLAQFPRSIKPEYRASSTQPSTYESHHDPHSEFAAQMGYKGNRETAATPTKASQRPQTHESSSFGQGQPLLPPGQVELAQVPHNEYPTDGMTMFCRTDASERSSNPSPVRPSSRNSSDYSNPTSFSSVEPSGKPSPIKHAGASSSAATAVQKKRSGFFSNSPFRRKSKHEKERSKSMAPDTRATWGTSQETGIASHDFAHDEPVDPRASFQLNVGPNVFDVASPDAPRVGRAAPDDLDPIAAALAELKGVAKQSSFRMSADRYHGLATPAPGAQMQRQNPGIAGQHGTPPPGYHEQSLNRLDFPQPAHTSAQMQAATRKYAGQSADMFGGRSGFPRSTSPMPLRSTSPRPGIHQSPNGSYNGRVSPNSQIQGSGRSRHSMAPQASPNGTTSNGHSRHTSPGEPASYGRNDRSGSNGQMSAHLSGHGARPMSQYGQAVPREMSGRLRSKSQGGERQFTREGRPILYFGKSFLTRVIHS